MSIWHSSKSYWARWTAYKIQVKAQSFWRYAVLDLVETILVAGIAALLIRHYLIQTSVVPTGSMISTLNIGDRLFVNKVLYRFVDPVRGDIVVFESPHGDGNEYVKRCVGVPGDTISVRKGYIYINDQQLVFPGVMIQRDYSSFGPELLGEGDYFMMGDNRSNSQDSRYWGTVSREDVVGKAWFTFWPFSRMRVLR
ncbi:MAG: signal peptidase I [Actinobacteria bacterium]|nr:signal peptidase I [Actinomycetota bacterium]